MLTANRAAEILRSGGVIAYPTEGVFGLGCLPHDLEAIQRLLHIKQREPSKGLILIAADASQFNGWIDLPESTSIPVPIPDKPITWVVPAGNKSTTAIRGSNAGIAVRITTNPVARSICEAVNSPIVSTSANLGGRPAASSQISLRRQFGRLVDYVVPGPCGPSAGPSEIRELSSGKILRPR